MYETYQPRDGENTFSKVKELEAKVTRMEGTAGQLRTNLNKLKGKVS